VVYKYLSPVSQTCSPNGCVMLTFLRQFGAKINPNKDINPLIAVHPEKNSQIAGSKVVTVYFLSDQFFQFVTKNKKYK